MLYQLQIRSIIEGIHWMAFYLFRSIFKQIHILSKQDSYLAGVARQSLRNHVDQSHKNLQTSREHPTNQDNHELLKSYLQFLEEANQQSSQFSQKAKMKLIQLVFNINKFVNNRFEIRTENKSLEMRKLQESQQFKMLKNQNQKDFVVSIMKKIFQGEETYDYRNLTDFFRDNRSQNCNRRTSNHLANMNPIARTYVERVLKGEENVSPYFKRIYEYYFTDISKEQIAFESYLNCAYILIDFDDVEQEWKSNTQQKDKMGEKEAARRKMLKEKETQVLKKKKELQVQISQRLQEQNKNRKFTKKSKQDEKIEVKKTSSRRK